MRFQCGTESVLQQLRKGQCTNTVQTQRKRAHSALSNSTRYSAKCVRYTLKYDIEILSHPLRFNSVTQISRQKQMKAHTSKISKSLEADRILQDMFLGSCPWLPPPALIPDQPTIEIHRTLQFDPCCVLLCAVILGQSRETPKNCLLCFHCIVCSRKGCLKHAQVRGQCKRVRCSSLERFLFHIMGPVLPFLWNCQFFSDSDSTAITSCLELLSGGYIDLALCTVSDMLVQLLGSSFSSTFLKIDRYEQHEFIQVEV